LASEMITCKIADIGFTRELPDGQLSETYCGTKIFCAPEVLAKLPYTNKADVWSLGCIFYEILFGVHPFKADNETQLR